MENATHLVSKASSLFHPPSTLLTTITHDFASGWASLVHQYPPQSIEFFGTLLVQLCTYWFPVTLFHSLDILAPSFSHRHKIQPIPKQPTSSMIWHAFVIVSRNQGLNMFLHALLLGALKVVEGKNSSYRIEEGLPGWREVAWQFSACILLRECMFYASHLLLHSKRFYGPIHKFHHTFTSPVAVAAQYAHPVEHLFANILPVSTPPQIVGAHILVNWMFLGFVLFETVVVQSGYDFAGGVAAMHDLHHERFRGNYGTVGIVDRIMGTYRRREEKPRDVDLDGPEGRLKVE